MKLEEDLLLHLLELLLNVFLESKHVELFFTIQDYIFLLQVHVAVEKFVERKLDPAKNGTIIREHDCILVDWSPLFLSKFTVYAFIISAVQPRMEVESKFLILCLNSLFANYLVLQVAFRYFDQHRKHLNELWVVRVLLLDGMRDFVIVKQELEQVSERVAVLIIFLESDLNQLRNVVVS